MTGQTGRTDQNGKTLEVDGIVRDCIVEMVDECLQHKGDDIDTETYFRNILDPLFRYLASDTIGRQLEDPIEFIQAWVEEKLNALPGANSLPEELVAPLPCLKAWCDRQLCMKVKHSAAMKTLQAEMASLQRQWKMLAEGLGRSAAGQSLLEAASAGDQAAFDKALETCGLSGSPSNVQIVASGGKEALLPPNAAEAEAAGTMGDVLKELRSKGMMSATAAFQHFQPGEDGCISTVQFLQEINSFGNISPQRTSHLANRLDTQSCGRINYQDFRSKISSFLASSRDFHSSLSADELHVVMTRIRTKLHERGITVSDAFKQCHVDASGTLEASDFMAGLRSLHLGLSVKEVAQVLNSLADVARVEGIDSTRVSLSVFENTLLGVSEQNPVKDWAATTYAKLREIVESGAINKSLRFYAEQPEHKHMLFCGFTAFVSDTEPSLSSVEKERLWCVLDKEPSVEDPAVSIAELMQWLAPHRPHHKAGRE